MQITVHKRLYRIAVRELRRIVARPIYLFCMVIAPIFCYIFFTTLMANGLPVSMPAGVVDMDNTATTRTIIRNLDAFQQTRVTAHYANFYEARKAVQRGEIYAFYYIPEGTTEEAIAGRQPRVSFYINYAYLIAGSLLYRDQRTMSELASGAIGQSTLLAKGATEDPAYALGTELKENTAQVLMRLADNSIGTALVGKLLPHTVIFFIVTVFYNVYLYGFLHYPCNGGVVPMLLAGLLLVLASQAVGIFFFGMFGTLRLALSAASLWGVISFSISGFTFPVMAMHPVLQGLTVLFPLRHYFLIYVNLALNGYSFVYVWQPIVALLLFLLLPFFVLKRLRTEMLHYVYIP